MRSAAFASPPLIRLPGHIPPEVSQAAYLDRMDSNRIVEFTLTLPLRNPNELQRMLTKFYNPNDSLFHRFLTPAQFTNLFSPTQESYEQTKVWALSNGLRIVGTHRSRTLLDVEGTVAAIEKALKIHINHYITPNGRIFHAPDSNPVSSMPAISGVIGLDNLAVFRPRYELHSQDIPSDFSFAPNQIGTGPGHALSPSDIKTAYNLNSPTQNGSGQTLGLFELALYKTSDISSYTNYFHLTMIPLLNVPVDGGSLNSYGNIEVTLDIEMMNALAPGASQLIVYQGPNTDQGAIDTYQRIASDDLAQQVSTSWGAAETELPFSYSLAEYSIFEQMAAQGQSIYAASGDHGSADDGSTRSVDDPAAQPYVTGVGGTTLATTTPGGPYSSEIAWSKSGGGASMLWPFPYYQNGFISVSSLGSTTRRNVPDVALDSDPGTGYSIYYGKWMVIGGTSCAAPLWAAFNSLVNQGRVTQNSSVLGFPNPALYTVAGSANYSADFHDIVTGKNGHYPAVPGYDDVTGLGSFNGANLLADLILYAGSGSNIPPPNSQQLLGNPGFENGSSNPAPWSVSNPGVINDSSLEPPNSGLWDAWLNGGSAPSVETVSQTVSIPAGVKNAVLSFFIHIDTKETVKKIIDNVKVRILNGVTHNFIEALATFTNLQAKPGYYCHQYNIANLIGKTITIQLLGTQTTNVPTDFVADDFELYVY